MLKRVTLSNGIRLLLVPEKSAKTVATLVLVGAGSLYEKKENNGISHFIEHMFFKGTKKRPTYLEITESLDEVGGVYNAFTSKEYTGYWAKVAVGKEKIAIDWLSDIILNSKIEQKEINKERGVIIEEMNMYKDNPMRYVEDLWENLLYGDQPAGWQIIGTEENVKRFKKNDFMDYLKTHYSAKNTIICVAGKFDEKKIIETIEKYFRRMAKKKTIGREKIKEKQVKPNILSFYKETDQTHLIVGVRAYNLLSEKRYPLDILSVILGGNMSSRLFVSIREKRGLAYYVRTSPEMYTDAGYLASQAGIPHKNLKKVVGLILKEYKRLKKELVPEKELKKAKEYIKGSSLISLEAPDSEASFYGMQELLTGRIETIEEKIRKIEKVTAKEIREVANDIFQPEKLNLALIGPHKNKRELEEILKI